MASRIWSIPRTVMASLSPPHYPTARTRPIRSPGRHGFCTIRTRSISRSGRMRALFALLLAAAPTAAGAQDAYPTRQISLIAPYAAGGSTDLIARVLSDGLKARFNQAVTVDNRPGGNGVIGTREVVKAPPDGYTLLIGALGAQVLPAVMAPNFPFDPLRDFIPVAGVAEWAGVMLVKKELPVNSLH